MNFSSAMESLATYAIILPLIPLCLYPVGGFIKDSPLRLALKVVVLVVIIALASLGILLETGENADIPVFICISALLFLIYCLQVKLDFFKKLFVFCTGCIAGAYSLLLTTTVDFILRPHADFDDFSLRALCIQLGILILFNAIFYLPLKNKLGWLLANFSNPPVWHVIWIIPASVTIMCRALIPHHYANMHIGKATQIFIVFIILLTIFTLLIYYLFYTIAHSIVEKRSISHKNHLLDMQARQYRQLLEKVDESSRLRHDFRHQLIVIMELLDKKDYAELEKYIHSYAEAVSPEISRYVSSPPLNALLSHYETLLRKAGVEVSYDLRLPENYNIADIDLCVIFGNLLENALFACDKMSGAFVKVKAAQPSSNTLAISVVNPYDQAPATEGGKFLSSHHEGLGQGLESVRLTAEKYGGTMEVSTSDGCFTVKILLYL
jgi:hypothetical protein